jgi:hypothetical protein
MIFNPFFTFFVDTLAGAVTKDRKVIKTGSSRKPLIPRLFNKTVLSARAWAPTTALTQDHLGSAKKHQTITTVWCFLNGYRNLLNNFE